MRKQLRLIAMAVVLTALIAPQAYAKTAPTSVCSQTGLWCASDYGAKGNGVTDDAPAIQTAINIANSSSGGNLAEVYLTSGTYMVGTTLSLPANTQLRGGGPGTILEALSTLSGDVIANAASAGSISVKDLVVNGNRTGAASATNCIDIASATDIAISNVTVHDCGADGIKLNAITRAGLTNVTSYKNVNDGIHALGASSYLNIAGSKAYDNGQTSGSGVDIAGTSARTTITGLSAYDDQGSPTQTYGVTEGGTANFTIIAGLVATGNVTASTNLTGANSVNVQTPVFSNPTISGACPTTAGALGYASSLLCVGDGSASHNLVSADQTQTLTGKTYSGGTLAGSFAGNFRLAGTTNPTAAASQFAIDEPLAGTARLTAYSNLTNSAGVLRVDTMSSDASVQNNIELQVAGGVELGVPTGGTQGLGSLNTAGAIYANGTKAISSSGVPQVPFIGPTFATSDTVLTSAATYYTCASLASLAAGGTYDISGSIQLQAVNANDSALARLYDSTNAVEIWSNSENLGSAASAFGSFTFDVLYSGYSGTPTLVVQGQDTTSAGGHCRASANGGGAANKAIFIQAKRVA